MPVTSPARSAKRIFTTAGNSVWEMAIPVTITAAQTNCSQGGLARTARRGREADPGQAEQHALPQSPAAARRGGRRRAQTHRRANRHELRFDVLSNRFLNTLCEASAAPSPTPSPPHPRPKEYRMANATLTGSALRSAGLSGYGDGRLVLVPLDHSVSDGPVTAAARSDDLVRDTPPPPADTLARRGTALRGP